MDDQSLLQVAAGSKSKKPQNGIIAIYGANVINVLIAEYNELLRVGIRSALRATSEIHIVAEVVSVEQFLFFFDEIIYDVLLISSEFLQKLSMGSLDACFCNCFRPKIIVLSHVKNPDQGIAALQSGVSGYLTSCCSSAELRQATFQVASGRRYIDRTLAEEISSFLLILPSALPKLLLSLREMRIYKMLVIGVSIAGIAEQLNTSVKEITCSSVRIIEKMQLDGISELIHNATLPLMTKTRVLTPKLLSVTSEELVQKPFVRD